MSRTSIVISIVVFQNTCILSIFAGTFLQLNCLIELTQLKSITMSIQIGQTAPDFTLFNSDKNPLQLSSLIGQNVLLLFFPQSFTGVCTKELCSVRDNIALYNASNATVLGISVDSVFTLAKFKEEQQLNFPLLSDFNKKVSELYETIYQDWILDMKGVSKRSAFLIDKNGTVQYAEVLENPGEVPNFEKINETLKSLA